MAIELHVLADARTLESFRLAPGMHVLGSTENAELLLSLLFHDRPPAARVHAAGPQNTVSFPDLDPEPDA